MHQKLGRLGSAPCSLKSSKSKSAVFIRSGGPSHNCSGSGFGPPVAHPCKASPLQGFKPYHPPSGPKSKDNPPRSPLLLAVAPSDTSATVIQSTLLCFLRINTHSGKVRLLPLVRLSQQRTPILSSLIVQMHRSYSLRQSRAPTAAQILMPAPPPSSTKGSRFFAGHLGMTFRKNTAGAFAPELAKRLTQLIKMEKSLMRSIELVAQSFFLFTIDVDSRSPVSERKSRSNSPFGAKSAMTMSLTSPINLASSSSKWANSKIALSVPFLSLHLKLTFGRPLRSISFDTKTNP